MNRLFTGLDHDAAMHVESLSRLIYNLREHRKLLLESLDYADEKALLDAICAGRADEHPAYEHYVSARVLSNGIEFARSQVAWQLPGSGVTPETEAPMPLQVALKIFVETHRTESLASPPAMSLDALTLHLVNDVALTVCYAATDTYSFRWRNQGAEYGIDTAPIHDRLTTTPNHFHDAHGATLPDPVTRVSETPETNFAALIDALLQDPSLGSGTG